MKMKIALYINPIIFLALLTFNSQHFARAEKREIKIAGLFSDKDGDWNGQQVRYLIEIAADLVRIDTTISEHFNLNITWRRSQCRRATALNEFLNFMQEKDNVYYYVFGPSCSIAAEPVGETVPSFSLNQLATTASSPGLTNAQIYPNTYLGMSTYNNLIVLYLKLIEKFNWRRVGVIHQEAGVFSTVVEGLSDEFKKINIFTDYERITNPIDLNEVDRKLDRLFMRQRHKVVIANFYEVVGFEVFCRAYKKNYISPHVTWIIPSWWTTNWFQNSRNATCTTEDMLRFLEGTLGVDNNVRLIDNNISAVSTEQIFRPEEMTIFNMTRAELWEEIVRRLHSSAYNVVNLDLNVIKYAQFAFDAMITLFKVFERALDKHPSILDEFNYHNRSQKTENDKVAKDLIKHINEVKFIGLTGKVSFKNRAREFGRVEIIEFRNGREVLIGAVDQISAIHLRNISSFKGEIYAIEPFRNCENDGVRCDGVEIHHLPIPALILPVIIAICALGFTVAFVTINLYYRKKKVIKLSSPLLNLFILSGAILQCIVAVLVVIDNRFLKRTPEDNNSECIGCTTLCHLVWWLPALATDLIFGTLIGKAFRVYMIAIRQSIKSVVKTTHIISFIGAIMLFDTGYTVIWAGIEAIRFQFIAEGPLETANTDITKPGNLFWYIFYCAEGGSPNSPAIIVRFFYIFLRWILYGVGLYFAYQIRKVNIRGINEFQSITLATLITIFFNLVRIILITMIPSVRLIDAAISLLSISYALDTCLIVSFLFIPKLYYIIKDPNEEKVYGGVHNTATLDMNFINQMQLTKLKGELSRLKSERDVLECEIREVRGLSQNHKTDSKTDEVILRKENSSHSIPEQLEPPVFKNIQSETVC